MTMQGNMAAVRDAVTKAQMRDAASNAQPGDFVGYGDLDPLAAQLEAGVTPAWYLVETMPGEHGSTAAHLIGRRFGVFIPEMKFEPELDCIEGKFTVIRGAALPRKCLMFPGHIFVFVWMSERNWKRLKNVPGIKRIVCYGTDGEHDGTPVTFKDAAIDELRALEAILCPVDVPPEWRTKRRRSGWRRGRRMAAVEDIIGRTYEAPRASIHIGNGQWIDGIEALRVLDECGAEHGLAARLGLAL